MIKYKVKSVKGYCEKFGAWETSPTSGLQVTFKASLNDKHIFTLTVCEEDYLLEHQVTTLDIEGLSLLNLCINSAKNLSYFDLRWEDDGSCTESQWLTDMDYYISDFIVHQ